MTKILKERSSCLHFALFLKHIFQTSTELCTDLRSHDFNLLKFIYTCFMNAKIFFHFSEGLLEGFTDKKCL